MKDQLPDLKNPLPLPCIPSPKAETEAMTSTIETTKRALFDCLERIKRAAKHRTLTAEFEERLEEHLEELRKEAAREYRLRRSAMQRIEEHVEKFSKLLEERDQLQDRLHAVDRAYVVLDQANKVAGEELRKAQEQASQDREDTIRAVKVADAMTDKVRLFESGELYQKIQKEARQHLNDCREAEKLSDDLDERLRDAQKVIGHQEQLIIGQRLAIADLYLKGRRPSATDGLTRAVSPEPIVKSDWI